MKIALHTYNPEDAQFAEIIEDLTFLGDKKGFVFKNEGHIDCSILVGDEQANPNGFDMFVKLTNDQGESRDVNTIQLAKANLKSGSYWSKLNSIIKRIEFNKQDYVGVVVLPTCSPDLFKFRDAIALELRQHSFDVRFGYNNLLVEESPLLSIHLLGGGVDESLMAAIDEDNKGCIELFKKMNTKNGFKRFLFYPDVTASDKQIKSVEWDNFKRQKENLVGADLLELTLEKFKTELFKSLKEHLKLTTSNMEQNSLIYLSFNREEGAEKNILEQVSNGFRVVDTKALANLSLKQYKDEMNGANAVVLHVDQAPMAWVASKLDDIIKSNGYRQSESRVRLIVVGDIDITELPQLNLVDHLYFKNDKELSAASLSSFLIEEQENA